MTITSLFRIAVLFICSVSLVASFATCTTGGDTLRCCRSPTSTTSVALAATKAETKATAPAAAADPTALTEFMARAHEEKLRALDRAEAKYKDRIEELEAKIEELEGPNTGSEATSSNSFAFPSTNKLLTEKVAAYRELLSNYFIKSQAEKQQAVQDAEQKLVTKYEAIIAELSKKEES